MIGHEIRREFQINMEVDQMTHLDLFVGGDGTEHDLREALSWKHAKADSPDDTAIFNKRESLVLPVLREKTVWWSQQASNSKNLQH